MSELGDLLVDGLWPGDIQAAVATLCTRAQVKERLGIPSTQTNKDDVIDSLIASLTRVINARYGREFMPETVSEVRTFELRNRLVDLYPYDLRSVTQVRLHPEDETNVRVLAANSDYLLKPIGKDPLTQTYHQIRVAADITVSSNQQRKFDVSTLEVTGAWGVWADVSEVPGDINGAAIETICSWIDRPTSQIFGTDGTPRDVNVVAPTTWDIPASAHRKFQPYSRNLGVW